LHATALADTNRTRSIDLNTTVGILRSFLLTGPSNLSVLTNTNYFVNITVSNRGNLDDAVTLSFRDPQGSAASALFSPSRATIPRGGSLTVEVRIYVPQATGSGNYTLNLSATSDADTTVSATLSLGLRVTQIRFNFVVSAPPHLVVNPDGRNTTTFSITNTGTVADTYSVAVPVLGSGHVVRVLDISGAQTTSFTLDPSASAAVTVELAAPRAVDRESFDIDLRITSAATGVEQTATVRADVGKIYDFRILPPVFSATPTIDVEIQVLVTVENAGLNEFFGALPVRMKLGTQEVASAPIGHLAVGSRQTLSFTWTPRLVGPVNVTVETNYQPALRIFESDYSNNVASVTVQVAPQKAPDLLAGPGALAAIAIVVGLLILFAVARRKDEEAEQPKKLEKAAEESEVRRRGGGSGGLERL